MRVISAADLVWIAVAALSKQHPERHGFSHDEIRRKVNELEPHHGFPDATIRTHITTHCVANKKPDPGKHRKLYANSDGSYRLYSAQDSCHPGRKDGRTAPDPMRVPEKYAELLRWARDREPVIGNAAKTDPILALAGVGKEVWRRLGGGEKFIREMRENWYGPSPHAKADSPALRKKRAV
jgi:hypothetical protein